MKLYCQIGLMYNGVTGKEGYGYILYSEYHLLPVSKITGTFETEEEATEAAKKDADSRGAMVEFI